MKFYNEASIVNVNATVFLREGSKDGGSEVAMSDGSVLSVTEIAGPPDGVDDDRFDAFGNMGSSGRMG